MKRNTNFTYLLILLIFVCGCRANEQPYSKDILLSQKDLEVQLAEYQSNETELARFSVEICLLSPCRMFEAASTMDKEVFYDFVLLYLLYEAEYVDLENMKQGKFKELQFVRELKESDYALTIMNKYVSLYNCESKAKPQRCILQQLRSDFKIKQYGVFIDEGKKVIVYEE